MSGALFTIVLAGVVLTGGLLHFGNYVGAACVAFLAYTAGRWVWSFCND
jgi:hypothetical protein